MKKTTTTEANDGNIIMSVICENQTVAKKKIATENFET